MKTKLLAKTGARLARHVFSISAMSNEKTRIVSARDLHDNSPCFNRCSVLPIPSDVLKNTILTDAKTDRIDYNFVKIPLSTRNDV